MVDRAAILGDGKRLDVATALGVAAESPAIVSQRRPGIGHAPASAENDRLSAPSIEPLDVVVRRHIETALTAARGQIEGRRGAAAMLKVNPHTLRARMRKLGIKWAQFRDKT